MSNRMYAVLAALVVAFTVEAAEAAKRSFSIHPFSITADPGLVDQEGGVNLPDNADTSVFINFTLPSDYKAGSEVKLRLYMSSLNAPCDISFGAVFMTRSRPGVVAATDDLPGPGFGLPDGQFATLSFAAIQGTVVRTFRIRPATQGTIKTQKPGDGLSLVLQRSPDGIGDNCPGPAAITNIEVRYVTP